MENKNSALYWLPKIKDIDGINVPRTEIVRINPSDMLVLGANLDEFRRNYGDKFDKTLQSFSFPVFVKTDELAGKHDWKKTCYVETESDLYTHIQNLGWCCRMVDVPLRAILIREYLDLEKRFTFFHGDMPVAKERRYFVEDGTVCCHHAYWDEMVFKDSFEMDDLISELTESDPKYSTTQRRDLLDDLREINTENEDEIRTLTKIAKKIGSVLDGAWSVDFACDINGKWWTIDIALAMDSWHPKNCPYYDKLSNKERLIKLESKQKP